MNGVATIGHRLGVPTIYVHETITDHDVQCIKELIKQYRVSDYDVIEICEMRPLSTFSVGTKLEIEDTTYATVGGYAQINKQPCALLSGHSVYGISENSKVKIGGYQVKLQNNSFLSCDPAYDIAAFVMDAPKHCSTEIEFDGRFKTPGDEHKCCEVLSFQETRNHDVFYEMPVFFRGASTTLGNGLVTSVNMGDGNMQKFMQFEDVDQRTPFCQPGDSGSIVCYDDEKDDKIKALAMLRGILETPDSRNFYCGIRLEDSLSELSKTYGSIRILDKTFKAHM